MRWTNPFFLFLLPHDCCCYNTLTDRSKPVQVLGLYNQIWTKGDRRLRVEWTKQIIRYSKHSTDHWYRFFFLSNFHSPKFGCDSISANSTRFLHFSPINVGEELWQNDHFTRIEKWCVYHLKTLFIHCVLFGCVCAFSVDDINCV